MAGAGVSSEDADLGFDVVVNQSAIHGKGLFANELIPKDAWIGTLKGKRTLRNGSHVLWVTEDDGEVYGISGKNRLRYVNHSPRPNAAFYGADLFAERTIEAGEEITFDYGEEWSE